MDGSHRRGIVGEEFSDFGPCKEDGGIQIVEVPDASPAGKAGLGSNDFIQSINGKNARTLTEFQAVFRAVGAESLKGQFIRSKQELNIEISR